MDRITRWPVAAAATIGLLVMPASAAQAAVPTASTGGATGVTASSAKVHASVNPKGEATTYYFEYGTTRRYGSRTPSNG